MTDTKDDEIIRQAEAIIERRKRAERGRNIYRSQAIQIVTFGADNEYPTDKLDIESSPELGALLCKVLDVPLSYGAYEPEPVPSVKPRLATLRIEPALLGNLLGWAKCQRDNSTGISEAQPYAHLIDELLRAKAST